MTRIHTLFMAATLACAMACDTEGPLTPITESSLLATAQEINPQASIETTKSGLKYIVTAEGEGHKAGKGALVQAHYTGKLMSGKVFDSSHKRGEPFSFTTGQRKVIKGWDEAFADMKKGEKRILIIPSKLAYGPRGLGPIPANAELVFEVELLSFTGGPGPQPDPLTEASLLKTAQKLNANAKIETTQSGLKYIVTTEGEGQKAGKGALVKAHYTGKLMSGKVFDSSHKRDEPFSFTTGQGRVIKGWDEAFADMKKGEQRLLIIPPNLAYGDRSVGQIPANATLIFDVELIGF